MDISTIIMAKYKNEWFFLSPNTNDLFSTFVCFQDEVDIPWVNSNVIENDRVILKNKNGKKLCEILYETDSQLLIQEFVSKRINILKRKSLHKNITRSNIKLNINYLKNEMDS